MKSLPDHRFRDALIALCIGIAAGAGLAAISPGNFFNGWLDYALLLILSIYLLIRVARTANSGRLMLVMTMLAFGLRLVLGVGLSQALPKYGYPEAPQQAGYIFFDAYQRDSQAWQLAQSNQPLSTAFVGEYTSDQYGGLLALSAALYRGLSPDAHRSYLVLILGAFTAAMGVPYLWRGLRTRWGESTANIALWIYILYPDSLLMGAAQMREPFLMGLAGIAFWALLEPHGEKKHVRWLPLVIALAVMALISFRAALPVAGVLAVWYWLEHLSPRLPARWQKYGWLALVLAGLALLVGTYAWLKSSAAWDILLTEIGSGRVQVALEEVGDKYRVPFMVVYGLAQPVLPAAIAEPSLPIWTGIAIFRAVGWYALVPFLLTSIFLIFRMTPAKERQALLWLAVSVGAWILIASLRAGGDQWDNPRYRLVFMPWLALLAARVWVWTRETRDPWLGRVALTELVFLGFFGNWYFSRYTRLVRRLPFWTMVEWIVGLAAVILGGGALWDYWRGKKRGDQAGK
jgi:hypothetical protein